MYERSIKTINGFRILPEAEYWMERELKVKLGWDENRDAHPPFLSARQKTLFLTIPDGVRFRTSMVLMQKITFFLKFFASRYPMIRPVAPFLE